MISIFYRPRASAGAEPGMGPTKPLFEGPASVPDIEAATESRPPVIDLGKRAGDGFRKSQTGGVRPQSPAHRSTFRKRLYNSAHRILIWDANVVRFSARDEPKLHTTSFHVRYRKPSSYN
jgi:hypothetical protein